jgi:hypothetical protein
MQEGDRRAESYRLILAELEEASRQHAGATSERADHQDARAYAIVAISNLGVPRATVAKLTGLTAGRVQQILEGAGASGATGEDWNDPQLRRLVESAIAARPIPSIGVGLRRESPLGPHVGRGYGTAVRLTGDREQDRAQVVEVLERLAERARSGDLDEALLLTTEERELIREPLLDDAA